MTAPSNTPSSTPTRQPESRRREGGLRRTFASLSQRDYAWYFVGNSAFFMAMQMNFVVRGFLAYDLTDSATALGMVSIAFAVPMMFVAPFAGVVSDRVNKRTLLMFSQMGSAAINLVMGLLVLTGLVEFWHLLLAGVCTGSIMSLVMPARQAVIPQLVPQHMLMNAISLQMGGMNLTRIIGPALGGVLIAPVGVGGVYITTVILFTLSVISLIPLPRHGMVSTEGTEPKAFLVDLVDGFKYIGGEPLFRLLITAALVLPLFMFPVQQIIPVFTADIFHSIFPGDEDGALALGLMMAATGVGGLIGAIYATTLSEFAKKGWLMMAGAIFMSLCFLLFASTSLWMPVTPAFWFAVLLLIAGNVGAMLFQVTNNTVVQARVPDQYRGRVMSVLMMSFGTMPLGVLPVSLAADAWGAPIAVVASQVVALTVIIVIFGLSKRLRRFEFTNLAHAELSPAQAATLVAEGKISREEADRLTGRDAPREVVAAGSDSRGSAAG
ncbi:MAG: MFS transporter [Chloroflexi bacterium]|nr:MFS transporter [Chloroflexota bacterium]